MISGRATESPTVRRGCNELYGFWNTYWIRRRWAVVRSRESVEDLMHGETSAPLWRREQA